MLSLITTKASVWTGWEILTKQLNALRQQSVWKTQRLTSIITVVSRWGKKRSMNWLSQITLKQLSLIISISKHFTIEHSAGRSRVKCMLLRRTISGRCCCSRIMWRHCITLGLSERRLVAIAYRWRCKISTWCLRSILIMLPRLMAGVLFRTDWTNMKMRFMTFQKRLRLNLKMQYTGITVRAALETVESKCSCKNCRFNESLNDFNKSIDLESGNPVIFSNRGLVNRKLENFEAAIIDYTNELTYSSNQNIKALNNRAYCFAKLGKYEQAITDYTRVLNIDPNNIHALHNRGISHERLA